MSHDIVVEGPVLDAGEESTSTEVDTVKVLTTAQLAQRISGLTAAKATAAISKGGKGLDRLIETTDGLTEVNALIGAKVKENDTFLGAYAFGLYVKGKGMTSTDFAAARGVTKSRVTQLSRTWRLFSEYDIVPGTPEWSMTSGWQDSSAATALFAKKGPAATRQEIVDAYAASKLPKPAIVAGDTPADNTPAGDTPADNTPNTPAGDAPNTADNASQGGTGATGDNRANRPNGESDNAPDFTGWKAIDRVKHAQIALQVKPSEVKSKESREILAAIMAQCALLMES